MSRPSASMHGTVSVKQCFTGCRRQLISCLQPLPRTPHGLQWSTDIRASPRYVNLKAVGLRRKLSDSRHDVRRVLQHRALVCEQKAHFAADEVLISKYIQRVGLPQYRQLMFGTAGQLRI